MRRRWKPQTLVTHNTAIYRHADLIMDEKQKILFYMEETAKEEKHCIA